MTTERYYYSIGKRKSAVARVRLYPGDGSIIVNEKPYDELFNRPHHRRAILKPLEVTESTSMYRAEIRVRGGGITGWAEAIAHGISRALVVADEERRKTLRRNGLLTRDARVKERKKYGLKRARKAPQYTKR